MSRTVLMLASWLVCLAPLSVAGDGKAAAAVTGKVFGKVLNAESQAPMAGVEVRLLKDGTGNGFPLIPTRTRSGQDGVFQFTGLGPGRYSVYAFDGNKASRSRLAEFDKASVDANGNSEPVSLQMIDGLQVRVRVLAEATNRPIPNAAVRLRWTDLDDDFATDRNGEVLISCLIPGDQYVEARADGHQLASTTQVLKDKLTEVTLKLPPGGSIRGTVQDKDGNALEGVELYVNLAKGSGLPIDHAITDASGRFMLNNVPLSEALRIRASKKDFDAYSINEFSLNGEPYRPLTVQLKPRPDGGDVDVTVVDRNGRPVSGASIANFSGSSEKLNASTGPDGKCSLKRLYLQYGHDGGVLFVRAEGFAAQQIEVPRPKDGTTTAIKVVLEQGHRFRGRVVNSKGEAVKNASVYFNDGNINSQMGSLGGQLRPDSEGRFSTSSFDVGTTLNVFAQGYSPRDHIEIHLDQDTETQIVLEPVGHLKGRVIAGDTGKPVPKFNIKLQSAAVTPPGAKAANGYPGNWSEPGKTIADREGRFVWPELPDGVAYDATFSADGFEPMRMASLIASTSPTAEIKVELQPIDPKRTAQFGGRIMDQKGDPLEGVVVHLLGVDPEAFPPNYPWREVPLHLVRISQAKLQPMCRFDHQSVTDAEGRFDFPRVSTKWKCELVYWSDTVPTTRIADLEKLKADQQRAQEIIAPAGVTIIGEIDPKVFPEVGHISAAPSSELSFDSRQHQFKEGQPATSFILRGLPAGPINIQLMSKPTIRRENGSTTYLHTTLSTRMVLGEAGQEIRVRFE